MKIKAKLIDANYRLIQKGTRIHAIRPVMVITYRSKRFKGFRTICGQKIEEEEYHSEEEGLPTCLSCLSILVGQINHFFWFSGINKHEWAKKIKKSSNPEMTLVRLMTENLEYVLKKYT